MISYESTRWFETYFDARIVGSDSIYMKPQSQLVSYAYPISEPADTIDTIENNFITQNIITVKIPEEQLNFIMKTFQQLDSEQEMRRYNTDLSEQYQSYNAMLHLLYSLQLPTKLY
jgi:vesicle coat complex subunit